MEFLIQKRHSSERTYPVQCINPLGKVYVIPSAGRFLPTVEYEYTDGDKLDLSLCGAETKNLPVNRKN